MTGGGPPPAPPPLLADENFPGPAVAGLLGRADLTVVGRLTVVDARKVRQRPLPGTA